MQKAPPPGESNNAPWSKHLGTCGCPAFARQFLQRCSTPKKHFTLQCLSKPFHTYCARSISSMGPGPGGAPHMAAPMAAPVQQQGLPPVGQMEHQVSQAAGLVTNEAMQAIGRLAQADPTSNFEVEATAHIQELFRRLRAAISDLKMAVDEQET